MMLRPCRRSCPCACPRCVVARPALPKTRCPPAEGGIIGTGRADAKGRASAKPSSVIPPASVGGGEPPRAGASARPARAAPANATTQPSVPAKTPAQIIGRSRVGSSVIGPTVPGTATNQNASVIGFRSVISTPVDVRAADATGARDGRRVLRHVRRQAGPPASRASAPRKHAAARYSSSADARDAERRQHRRAVEHALEALAAEDRVEHVDADRAAAEGETRREPARSVRRAISTFTGPMGAAAPSPSRMPSFSRPRSTRVPLPTDAVRPRGISAETRYVAKHHRRSPERSPLSPVQTGPPNCEGMGPCWE